MGLANGYINQSLDHQHLNHVKLSVHKLFDSLNECHWLTDQHTCDKSDFKV